VAALALGLAVASAIASACGNGDAGPSRTANGAGGSPVIIISGSGGTNVNVENPTTTVDGGRPMRCDGNGQCACINVASFGKPAHYGNANDNTDAFQTWLNTKSSARVDLVRTHTPLTAELLRNYDVLVLQALEDNEGGPFWTFSADEIKAVSDWVNAGGGIISLMGYGGDAREVEPTNALLAFSGISYNKDDILAQCPNNLCYCWGNTIPISGFLGDHPIAKNLTQIGGFHGRSINAGGASVIAKSGDAVVAAGKTIGQGKVFVFADEWITYTSQWLGSGQQQTVNVNDPCYDPAHDYMMTADKVFQVPQFWYNAIKWAAPPTQCFTIDNPTIVK
ncbi:MAG TPA: hypothetical protein VFQ35_00660, partial [Polyangiaceae bacterium]|nr:hypothetical protein [Polyangiaceae bacterium]